jgi:hypothetical protein
MHQKTCSSRLSLKENLEVIAHTPHNHNTYQKALNKIQIHEKIKYMAVITPKSKNEIVCSVLQDYDISEQSEILKTTTIKNRI